MLYRSAALILLLTVVNVYAQVEDPIVPPDPEAACIVCYNGEDPVAEPTSGVPYVTDVTCSDIIADVAASTLTNADAECQNYQLWGYQLGCCKYPPFHSCSGCPDGSEYISSNTIPTAQEVGTDPTCAEYALRSVSYVGLFEPGVCEDTYISRVAHFCGCPNVEQECYLCSDGQEPGNLARGDNFRFKARCEGVAFFFSIFSEDECTDAREGYGIDYEHFCECPDYVKPEDDGKCLLCEGGIKNPDFIFTDSTDVFDRTCQQAQQFADSITRESTCLELMAPILERGCECNSGETVFLADGESSATSLGLSTVTMLAMIVALSAMRN